MIVSRGPNKWQIRIYLGMENGEEAWKYETFHGTKTDARKRERALKKDADDSPNAPMVVRSFKSFAEEWYAHHSRKLMPNTADSYRQYINSAIEILGEMKMGEIEEHHMTRYFDALMDGTAGALIGKKNPKRAQKSQNTVAKHFWVLRKLFRDALKQDSPMEYMESYRVKLTKQILPTDEQVEKLLDRVAEDPVLAAIFDLAIWNGMRRGEIFALEWADLKGNEISITKSLKHKQGVGWVIGPPKSENSIRSFVIDETTQSLLKKLRGIDNTVKLSGRVFSMTPNAFENRFDGIVKGEMGAEFTFHRLRHFCLTKMAEEGFTDTYIAERAGHDLNVLRGIYKHLGVKAKQRQDDKILERRKVPK